MLQPTLFSVSPLGTVQNKSQGCHPLLLQPTDRWEGFSLEMKQHEEEERVSYQGQFLIAVGTA